MSDKPFSVGDRVVAKPAYAQPGVIGRVFVVAKVNPKNLRCTAEDGGRGINFPAFALLAADSDEAKAIIERPGSAALSAIEFYSGGEIVTFDRSVGSHPAGTPFVVTKDSGRNKVGVSVLGSAADGDWNVGKGAGITRRDLAWLAEYLLEKATAAA